MVKNLQVSSVNKTIRKSSVHNLVSSLKKELRFTINDLSINFIHSEELLKINKKYLKHNFPTDIITFNYSKPGEIIEGEILISVEDAKVNALKYSVKYSIELSRIVIHGILHLLGYDDKYKKNKIIMKRLENDLLKRYKFILLAVR